MEYQVAITELDSLNTVAVRQRVVRDAVGEFIPATIGRVKRAVGDSAGMPYVRVWGVDDSSLDLEVGWTVTDLDVGAAGLPAGMIGTGLPDGPAAITMHVGSYDDVPAAYQAIEAWLSEYGYEPAGAPWESYLDGPEVAEPRTSITWPVRSVATTPGADHS